MNPDKLADDLIRELADMFRADERNKIFEYSPSVKIGRRYLSLDRDGYTYNFQVEVASHPA